MIIYGEVSACLAVNPISSLVVLRLCPFGEGITEASAFHVGIQLGHAEKAVTSVKSVSSGHSSRLHSGLLFSHVLACALSSPCSSRPSGAQFRGWGLGGVGAGAAGPQTEDSNSCFQPFAVFFGFPNSGWEFEYMDFMLIYSFSFSVQLKEPISCFYP